MFLCRKFGGGEDGVSSPQKKAKKTACDVEESHGQCAVVIFAFAARKNLFELALG